jgi:hypothetical protein
MNKKWKKRRIGRNAKPKDYHLDDLIFWLRLASVNFAFVLPGVEAEHTVSHITAEASKLISGASPRLDTLEKPVLQGEPYEQ